MASLQSFTEREGMNDELDLLLDCLVLGIVKAIDGFLRGVLHLIQVCHDGGPDLFILVWSIGLQGSSLAAWTER